MANNNVAKVVGVAAVNNTVNTAVEKKEDKIMMNLESLKVKDLKEKAMAMGLTFGSKIKKAELISLIQEKIENIIEEKKEEVEMAKVETKVPAEEKVAAICFTGRRPKDLGGAAFKKENYEALFAGMKENLLELIGNYQKNVENVRFKFISGGAQGFDQLAFWVVNKIKAENPDLKIENVVYVPFKGQESRWANRGLFSQAEYNAMLKYADQVVYLAEEITEYKAVCDAMIARNHKMVDDSVLVIGLYPNDAWKNNNTKGGTAECLRYALKQNKRIWQWAYTVKNCKVLLKKDQKEEKMEEKKKDIAKIVAGMIVKSSSNGDGKFNLFYKNTKSNMIPKGDFMASTSILFKNIGWTLSKQKSSANAEDILQELVDQGLIQVKVLERTYIDFTAESAKEVPEQVGNELRELKKANEFSVSKKEDKKGTIYRYTAESAKAVKFLNDNFRAAKVYFMTAEQFEGLKAFAQ